MYPNDTYHPFTYETKDSVYFFTSALDPLNNWSAHAVSIWGCTFPTLEHAYHWRKYYQTSPKTAQNILQAPSPYAAMQIDRSTPRELRRDDWDEVKVTVMRELLRAKIKQNSDVAKCLRMTGNKQIVENSPFDSFWGCGPDKKGQNVMGQLLMQMRDELHST